MPTLVVGMLKSREKRPHAHDKRGHGTRANKVMALTAGLLVATAGVLALDRAPCSGNDLDAGRQFQRMAGGLGLGATVRPRWCFVNFDPRLEHCTCAEQPVPGGYCYCPEHTATVSFFDSRALNVRNAGEHETSDP